MAYYADQQDCANAQAAAGVVGGLAAQAKLQPTPSETIASRAYSLANAIEAQAARLEAAVARIFGSEGAFSGEECDKPSPALPTSLGRAQMAVHRIAKCVEALGEVA